MSQGDGGTGGMSPTTARAIEACIIGLCIATLLFIFQPFSKWLSGLGMSLVVFAGLAFNLVPFCEPGRAVRDLLRVALIVVVIFIVVFALAVTSAWLYGEYLKATR